MGAPAAGAATPASGRYRAWVLTALVLVYTFNFVDRQILSILLEPIKADLGLSDTAMGFLTGFGFAIFYATLGLPIAVLADRWNRRTIVAASLALWSAMTALSGLATSFWQLAAARIGVGVGEAGGSPPSYSLISDYFPPERRATALSIYSMGLPLGVLLGFLVGGWVNDLFDWRTAFFVVGLPGLVLAAIVQLTVREPARGLSEGRAVVAAAPPFRTTIAFIWSQRALRHVCFGTVAIAFANYAFLTWMPAFLIRSHGLAVSTVGTAMALIVGLSGALTMVAAGAAADRFARRDRRWLAWLPALAALAAAPAILAMLLADAPGATLALMVIPAAMGFVHLGPAMALMQTLVAPRMRAVSGALFLFLVNLVGLGLGPQAVGMVSDLLAPALGAQSLRYAIMVAAVAALASAAFFRAAARYIEQDARRLAALAA